MSKLTVDITMSVDGFIAGPNQTLEQPLGAGGERLHEWLYGLASFRERHGLEGGVRNADSEVPGLLDEPQIHLAPLLLGGGVRLFDDLGTAEVELELDRVIESPSVTHLTYRVVS
jgi:hypothetical protein